MDFINKTIKRKRVLKFLIYLFLTIIPAYDYYISLFKYILNESNLIRFDNIQNISLSNNIVDIITGILMAFMAYLYFKSLLQYNKVKEENKRIREMLLTIHLFDNIRFAKIRDQLIPELMKNEEDNVRKEIKRVFKNDLGVDYSEEEVKGILDTFYRKKPKFVK